MIRNTVSWRTITYLILGIFVLAMTSFGLLFGVVAASTQTVTVQGTDDIWFAGRSSVPSATLPVEIDLNLFSGAQELSFSVTGETRRDPVQTPLRDADGERPGDFCCGTVVQQLTAPPGGSSGSPIHMSGIIAPYVSLIGVFVDSDQISTTPPPTLDFGDATSRSFTQLSPSLQQLFFIGDGLTGTGSGSVQTFVIPSGADTLYLGVLDGLEEGSYPDTSSSRNNSGQLQVTIEAISLTLAVNIDIKPGSDPNCFNNDGNGAIPVAILGSADFDVTQIDAESVALEGMAVKAVGKSNKLLAHIEDSNGDGFDDLVVQIEDTDGIFEVGDTTAILTGNLLEGTSIEGSDSICITQ